MKIYIRMPSSCCDVGCTNRLSKVCSVRFYRIRFESEKEFKGSQAL